MGVKVYISGQTFSNQVRNEQRTILDFLRGNGIEHSTVDVSQNPTARKELVASLGEETTCTGLAPMIFNDDEYLGQFTEFFNAKEADTLFQFFKLEPPENSREKAVWNRANKPPTPEPEPEAEEPEEGANDAGQEGEDVETPEDTEGAPSNYPEGELEEEPAETTETEEPAEATDEPEE